nr:hypothetical protein CFP56_06387 [Quercus suber]
MFEVRSSDLEMGLSSSDDRVISKTTSISTPYKAWTISCSLTGKDEQQISLRFPVYPFVNELFSYLHLAPAQQMPNSWHILVSCMVVWMFANDGDVIRRDEFLHFYRLRKSKDPGYYEFMPWDRTSRLILDYPSSLRNWKPNFLFISRSD